MYRLHNAALASCAGLISFQRVQLASCESAKTMEILVGKASSIKEGAVSEYQIDASSRLLLTRQANKVIAVSGLCPHYGFPLAKGAINDGCVTCPLHAAKFKLADGSILSGPAFDALPSFPVRVNEKTDEAFVTVPAEGVVPMRQPRTAVRRDPKNEETFVIVGGGAAGFSAVENLRASGFTGRIVMLTSDSQFAYDRPVLTKRLISPLGGATGNQGAQAVANVLLKPEKYYAESDIEVFRNSTVTAVDPLTKAVEYKDQATGETKSIKYSKCLVATGGEPRQLFVPGMTAKNVFTVRTVDDALALSRFLEKGQKVVVVGGSFIGMETASMLTTNGGVDVTIVSKNAMPYEKSLGKKVAAMFANLLMERNIKYYGNRTVKMIRTRQSDNSVSAVVLDDGDVLQADAVIIGAGVIPNTELLKNTKKLADGSVQVGPTMESLEHKDLFIAGDICTFPYVKTGTPTRVEHWNVAIQQGRVASSNMIKPHSAVYDTIPFFWTMVFGKSLRYVGSIVEGAEFDNVVIEGDVSKCQFVAYYIKGDRVAAVATAGRDPIASVCSELFRTNKMPTATEILLGVVNSDGLAKRLNGSASS